MNFEETAKELYRDLVLQAVMDSANRVVGNANRCALIAEALERAYEAGRKEAKA